MIFFDVIINIMSSAVKNRNEWMNVLNKLEDINHDDIDYLIKNIPLNMRDKLKNIIYNIIDNLCLKITGMDNKEEMELLLNKMPYSVTSRLYDLKFFVANRGKEMIFFK